MLNSPDPFTNIVAPISPLHFSMTISFIIFILPSINIARCPSENTLAIFFVSLILTLIIEKLSRLVNRGRIIILHWRYVW